MFMVYTINLHCKFIECFNKYGILLSFLRLLQLQPSSKVAIPTERDMKCPESGGVQVHQRTLWESQCREIAVLFRNLSWLQTQRSEEELPSRSG